MFVLWGAKCQLCKYSSANHCCHQNNKPWDKYSSQCQLTFSSTVFGGGLQQVHLRIKLKYNQKW